MTTYTSIASGINYHPQSRPSRVLEIYHPTGTRPQAGWPVVVWINNSGFQVSINSGSITDSLTQGKVLTHGGWAVVQVQTTVTVSASEPPIGHGMYRSPADAEYDPEGNGDDTPHQDVKWAIQWVHHFGRLYGLDINRVTIAGGSAGGVLSTWPLFTEDFADADNPIAFRRKSSKPKAGMMYRGFTWAHGFIKTVAGGGPVNNFLRKATDDTLPAHDTSAATNGNIQTCSPVFYTVLASAQPANRIPIMLYAEASSVGDSIGVIDFGINAVTHFPNMTAGNSSGIAATHHPWQQIVYKKAINQAFPDYHTIHSPLVSEVALSGAENITPDAVIPDEDDFVDYWLLWLESEVPPQAESYIPLGYIPSALEFETIDDYDNIPPVYDICHDLDSSAVFYEVPVSDTFPSRGQQTFDMASCLKYFRRHGPDPVIRVMYETYYARALRDAENYLKDPAVVSAYGVSASFMNLAESLANVSGTPSGFDIYENFEFGLNVHKLYQVYARDMLKHATNLGVIVSSGFNIFSHTYGPLLFNGDFYTLGGAGALATTSLNNIITIKGGPGGVLSFPGGLALGTYPASGFDLYNNIEKAELRNPHIVSGIELVNTFGSNLNNSFVVSKLDNGFASPNGENFSIDNTIIKSKSLDNFPRLRIDLKQYNGSSNYFIPEHEFNLKLKTLIGTEGTTQLGGGAIGVWLHTFSEGGYLWTWTKNRRWEHNQISSITIAQAQSQLAYSYVIPPTTVNPLDLDTGIVTDGALTGQSLINIDTITSRLFSDLELNFNTYNYNIEPPPQYQKVYGQVHRPNQRYVLEIFKYPNLDGAQYALFDKVTIKDLTLAEYATEYDSEQLLYIIRFFNSIANAGASRVASNTSGIFEASGGSRINYRIHPLWAENVYASAHQQYRLVNVSN